MGFITIIFLLFVSVLIGTLIWIWRQAISLRHLSIAVSLRDKNNRHLVAKVAMEEAAEFIESCGATYRLLSQSEEHLAWQIATGHPIAIPNVDIIIVGTASEGSGKSRRTLLTIGMMTVEAIMITGDGVWFGSHKEGIEFCDNKGYVGPYPTSIEVIEDLLVKIVRGISVTYQKDNTYVRYRRKQRIRLSRVIS